MSSKHRATSAVGRQYTHKAIQWCNYELAGPAAAGTQAKRDHKWQDGDWGPIFEIPRARNLKLHHCAIVLWYPNKNILHRRVNVPRITVPIS